MKQKIDHPCDRVLLLKLLNLLQVWTTIFALSLSIVIVIVTLKINMIGIVTMHNYQNYSHGKTSSIALLDVLPW